MIKPQDIKDNLNIKDDAKAESIAIEISKYASTYNYDESVILEKIKEFKDLKRHDLIQTKFELEGKKTILKQKLMSNLVDSDILERLK